MKHTLLIIAALLGFISGYSQSSSRVIAFANYGADTTVTCVDTGGYIYHTDRGGVMLPHIYADYPFSSTIVMYDFELDRDGVTKFDSAWRVVSGDTDVSIQLFDADNNIIYAARYVDMAGNWTKNQSYGYTYDAHHNMLAITDTNGGAYTGSTIYTYDADNRIATETAHYTDTNEWRMATNTYNPLNQLTLDVVDKWDVATATWLYESKDTFEYNTAGFPETALGYYASTGSTANTATYYFSPGNDSMIYSDANQIVINTYNADHNKISTTQRWLASGVFTLWDQEQWSFNSFGQVTEDRFYSFDTSSNLVIQSLNRYYYEPYIATGVVPVAASANDLKVFPSPAQNTVTLNISWATAQPFTINFINTAGQLVQQWHEAPTQQLEKSIDVSRLPAGNYIISATAESKQLVQRFVVQH